MKRTLALILSLVMCLGLLAGCGDKKTDDGQTDGKTLVVGTQNFDGKFSPFFYTNDYENQVMGMVFDGLFLVDREGSVVLKGIEGDVRPYNGTDYTYKGIADCDIVENSDGTVDYNITLKEGVKFSDGEEMTIDDVIFSYYVLLDPAYDGVSTLYSLPIKGLEAYRQLQKKPQWNQFYAYINSCTRGIDDPQFRLAHRLSALMLRRDTLSLLRLMWLCMRHRRTVYRKPSSTKGLMGRVHGFFFPFIFAYRLTAFDL